ncbi:F-box protein-like [Zostera marina]|uniref:F-box protein-like n=1 Tax=Zostera marina TaxID=29655 RepID=A0A0K9Q185_ZOSMR|nr:F-box protein-like [Zostera marina]
MDSMPEAIVQHILSQISNARDIAVSKCVSMRWKDSVPYIPSLYFPRNVFGRSILEQTDASIGRMILAALRLEELVIYCPFSAASLAMWLSHKSSSLRRLELRMDNLTSDNNQDSVESATTKLDCIELVKGLESLKLWGVCLINSPKWTAFDHLLKLEIVGAGLKDQSLFDALQACPNLTDLALLGCEGVSSVNIKMNKLKNCRLDFLGAGHCLLSIISPKLQVLDIQGFNWIEVNYNHCLRSVSISKVSGRVYKVDLGKLDSLEYLSVRGVQWSWNALHSVLTLATEVKHLVMKVEFCGDLDKLLPFPLVDLVEFFNHHPKLCSFEIHGAMFAALCQKDSLRNLDSNFKIPCLEQLIITVRSPLNAEQKLNTLESLVKHSKNLKKLGIRISQMRNCQDIADDFFEEICGFAYMNNKVVYIE